jgi:predicted RNase H-like HicB family nuclease
MSDIQMTAEEFLRRPYTRVLIPDAESGTFAAMIPEFPGCITQGDSPDEAYARLHEAALAWIEAAQDLGQQIPGPREENTYGGKFALRMPASLHKDAAEAAERDGTSLNQFVVAAIAERIGANKLYAVLSKKIEVLWADDAERRLKSYREPDNRGVPADRVSEKAQELVR